MAFINIAEHLNFIVKGYSDKEKFNIEFYQGNLIENVTKLTTKIAPFSKVALVCYEDTFSSFIKPLADKLKKCGIKPIAMLFKYGSDDTVKSASQLFSFPEDVRAIITVDAGLYRICSYFASVKQIPIICGLNEFDTHGICDNLICLKNGDKIDKINLDVKRYVIIDDFLFDKNDGAYNAYANVMSRTVSLIDYRMRHANNGTTPSSYLFDYFKDAVTETFNFDGISQKERAVLFLKNSLTVELINALSHGEFTFSSAETVVLRLLNGFKSSFDYGLLLYVSVKILGIYDVYFNCKASSLLTFTDYNEYIDVLCREFKLSETQLLDGLQEQLIYIKKGKSRSEGAKFKLKKEVSVLNKLGVKTLERFKMLGGSINVIDDRLKTALKHCGDTFYGINTMSLAREAGVTEFIRI